MIHFVRRESQSIKKWIGFFKNKARFQKKRDSHNIDIIRESW